MDIKSQQINLTNEKQLKITPIATNMIAASLNDEDVYLGLVNATFAIAAKLTSPMVDASRKTIFIFTYN